MRHSGPILACLALSQGDAPPPGRTADVRPYAGPQQTGGPYGAFSVPRHEPLTGCIRLCYTPRGVSGPRWRLPRPAVVDAGHRPEKVAMNRDWRALALVTQVGLTLAV